MIIDYVRISSLFSHGHYSFPLVQMEKKKEILSKEVNVMRRKTSVGMTDSH